MLSTAIIGFDRALRTLTGLARSSRAVPGHDLPDAAMSEHERRVSAGLMRVNHTGEVCAQALYAAQAAVSRDPSLAARFASAAREEEDHLAWTQARLAELDARPSLLNPLWYAGSFAIGVVAGLSNDRLSLGFVAETERQVERHLDTHLESLPADDERSRAILTQMRADERAHGQLAQLAGGVSLPVPVQKIMQGAARVMTTTARWI